MKLTICKFHLTNKLQNNEQRTTNNGKRKRKRKLKTENKNRKPKTITENENRNQKTKTETENENEKRERHFSKLCFDYNLNKTKSSVVYLK